MERTCVAFSTDIQEFSHTSPDEDSRLQIVALSSEQGISEYIIPI